MPTCRGLGCLSTELINAHVVPAGFARLLRGPDHVIKITKASSGRAKQQLGEYDNTILCANCDNKLGAYDKYALEVLASFAQQHQLTADGIAELRGIDGDRLAKFVLAVVWRASISSRRAYAGTSLGRYEDVARDVLFGSRTLASFREFSVFFARFISKEVDVEKFHLSLNRSKIGDLTRYHCYLFSLAGFRITAVFDARPRPSWLTAFAVNGNTALRAHVIQLESTTEFKKMREMAGPV